VNTIDSNFFLENIRAGYQQRHERHADRGKEQVEIVSHIYDIIKNSNQIVHNRGKALSYLTNKRKDGPNFLQPRPRKAPHEYNRVTGLKTRYELQMGPGDHFIQRRQQEAISSISEARQPVLIHLQAAAEQHYQEKEMRMQMEIH